MNITFTGHNVEITDAIRNFTHEKFARLTRHHDKISNIHVVYNVEKLIKIAEATLHIPHHHIFAKAERDDMYHAIDSLVDKLIIQLEKHKAIDRDSH